MSLHISAGGSKSRKSRTCFNRAFFEISLIKILYASPPHRPTATESTRDQTLVQNLEVSHKATIVVPSITQTLFVIFFHTNMNIETF